VALRNQPYLPLYVNDFMNDEKLKPCSAESTGVYIRIMCLLHKCEEYGALTFNELDSRTDDICYDFAMVLLPHMPYTFEVIHRSLKELTARKVLTIDGEKLTQKRMVKDGNISAARSMAGSAGGTAKASNSSKSSSKRSSKIIANSDIVTDIEIENDIGYVPSKGGFCSDSEMDALASGINAVLDAAERAGFPRGASTMDALNAIVADYGTEAVIRAIGGCVENSVIKLNYLRGILKRDPTGGTRERQDDTPLPRIITEV
jgi:hypothetical protein